MKLKSITLIILLITSLTFGCLGNSDDSQDVVADNNTTTVVVQEQSQANFWELMYWTSLLNNDVYVPLYYHAYTPAYGILYHSTPTYRPVYVTPTVTRTIYQVKDKKGTVLYKSTDGKAADNYRYRAAQRLGSGSGSGYKPSASTSHAVVKNYNSGDKPSGWKDNSKSVKSMRSNYRSSGFSSSGSRGRR